MSTTPGFDKLQEYRRFAEELAKEAGRISLSYFRKGVDVDIKSDNTPVTRADRETEQFIRSSLSERFPDHLITGEEFGSSIGSRTVDPVGPQAGEVPFNWIVDPIDGTKAFIHGVPLYTTLIALLSHGRPVVGIIHNPVLDETVSAATGGGCTLNGEKCGVSPRTSLSEARVQVTDFADLFRRKPMFTPALLGRAFSARTWADAYGYLLVATGRAEVALDPIMSLWDIAPLGPIITEAGGRFTTLEGDADWTGTSALATNGILHAEVLSLPGQ